ETLFQAAQVKTVVRKAPSGDAPIRVYASADAIYVTCPNASVLSSHAARLGGKSLPGKASGQEDPMMGEGMTEDEFKTMQPSQGGTGVEEIQGYMVQAEREGRGLTPVEKREIRRIARAANAGKATRMTEAAIA